MTESKSRDYFGTFLNELDRRMSGQSSPGEGENRALRMLQLLMERSPMPLRDLQAVSQLSYEEFPQALQPLKDAGYIEITGSPGEELCDLTDAGRTVASVAMS